EAFERGDLTTWPRGIYARAWVRAYANIIGLDPIDTVDEFCRLFPQGDRRAGTTFRDFATIVAHSSTFQDEFAIAPEHDRRRQEPNVNRKPPTWRDRVRRVLRRLRNIRNPRASRAAREVTTHTN